MSIRHSTIALALSAIMALAACGTKPGEQQPAGTPASQTTGTLTREELCKRTGSTTGACAPGNRQGGQGRQETPPPPPKPVYTGKLVEITGGGGTFCPDAVAAKPPQFWGANGTVGSLKYRGTDAQALAVFAQPQYFVPKQVIEAIGKMVAEDKWKSGQLKPDQVLCMQMYSAKPVDGKPDQHIPWFNLHSKWGAGKDARPHLSMRYITVIHGGYKWVYLDPPESKNPGAALTEQGCNNRTLFAVKEDDPRYS